MTDHVDTQTAVVATLPDGTKIAVDQLPTGELVQIVKLYDGAADSTNAASVSAAGALKVDGSGVTQPVSGPLTDAQLRATPVPVSGAVTVSDGSGPLTVDGTVAVSNFPATQPVSAAALPLPAGAATEGGHLAAIDVSTAKIPSQGQALAAGSVPVVLTAIQQAALTPPAAIAGFALEAGHLAAIDTSVAKIPSQGQALAAGSVPVVLTAIQQTALTPPAAITGFALDATLTGGTQKAIARGGQKGTTNTNADITHTASGANHEGLDVVLYDAAGNVIDPRSIRALTNTDVVTNELSKWIGSAAPTVGQKTMASSLPVVISSDQTSLPTVGVSEVTYHALCRLAARPYALSKAAIAANSRTQFATLYHAAAAAKRLRLRRVLFMLESESVAGILNIDLVKLTAAVTPATGNPAITPAPARGANVAEATVLSLPTTGGTEGALIADLEYNVAITAAAGTANPPLPNQWFELFSEDEQNPMSEQESLEVAAGVAGGWAVVVDNTGATNTVKCKVKFVFTEK